ncbi:alpha/beta hydrolase family protein [Ornithinimicrobium panacihumi]|uniref:alpha/beta hydrolase family protein n=1 Tax=Ornithinimicrobium panacihumi TaxID=2008449 RepID=UPI003F8912F0
MHPFHDVIAAVGQVCQELAERAGIASNRIVFYGSSLGGFSAIAAASQIEGARAVAEVPQIDVSDWFPRPVAALETKLLGKPIDEFRQTHPERLNLKDRLVHAWRAPAIRLITNPEDRSYSEQVDFFTWLRNSQLPAAGPSELILTSDTSGHEVLSQARAVGFVSP